MQHQLDRLLLATEDQLTTDDGVHAKPTRPIILGLSNGTTTWNITTQHIDLRQKLQC